MANMRESDWNYSSNDIAPDIETASKNYAERFSGPVGRFFLKTQYRALLNWIYTLNFKTVLDIGGGHCQLAEPLIKKGYNVAVSGSNTGCNHRLSGILNPYCYKFVVSNNLMQPFKDRSFDFVVAFRILAHIQDWKGLIAEMCRVADNSIVFDYPDLRSFNSFYPYLFNAKKSFERSTRHFRVFNRKEIFQSLFENGFSVSALKPQFFLPMALHRFIESRRFSISVERLFDLVKATQFFGNPIIIFAQRIE